MENTEENYGGHFGWKENQINSILATFLINSFKRDKTASREYKISGPPKKFGRYSNIGVSVRCEQIRCPIFHKIAKWTSLFLLATGPKRAVTV